jgi:hypothetical protein
MIDVTVKIPEARVAEFYGLVGRWLAGELLDPAPQSAGTEALVPAEWSDTDEDAALARDIWAKLSPRARAMFTMLMEAPGRRVSGEEIAEALDIPNGKYGVAGVLAWPGRFCAAVNKPLPCRYADGPVGGSASYWMDDTVARLFTRAATND